MDRFIVPALQHRIILHGTYKLVRNIKAFYRRITLRNLDILIKRVCLELIHGIYIKICKAQSVSPLSSLNQRISSLLPGGRLTADWKKAPPS